MKRWPFARQERLCAMHRAGKRPAEIAEALGVSTGALLSKSWVMGLRFSRSPNCRPPPPPPVTTAPDVIALVTQALAEDPAGAVRAAGNRGSRLKAEKSWPLHLAAYVANVELGCTTAAAARMIGRTPRLAFYAIPRVEDRRDEPAFDAFMERLGDRAREMVA